MKNVDIISEAKFSLVIEEFSFAVQSVFIRTHTRDVMFEVKPYGKDV